MSDQDFRVGPGVPPPTVVHPMPTDPHFTPPLAAAPKRSLVLPLALAFAGLVVGMGIGLLGGVVLTGGMKAAADDKPAAAAAPARTTKAPSPAAPPKPTYHVPTKDDFALTVKILTKHCFGSAGCNVTYRVELTQRGDFTLDPDKEYEMTYQIKGLEDTTISMLTITGDQYSRPDEEMGSTRSSSAKLTVVITGISEH